MPTLLVGANQSIMFSLFMAMLALSGCQTAPQKGLSPAQIAVIKQQGFELTDEGWEFGLSGKVLFGMGTYGSRSLAVGGSAIIKATEGGDRVDEMFASHWRGAARAGVRRGAYHFFYHCRAPEEQAAWFFRHVPRRSGDLPPVIDMEWTPTSPTCTLRRDGATIRAEARIFMDIVERH